MKTFYDKGSQFLIFTTVHPKTFKTLCHKVIIFLKFNSLVVAIF